MNYIIKIEIRAIGITKEVSFGCNNQELKIKGAIYAVKNSSVVTAFPILITYSSIHDENYDIF